MTQNVEKICSLFSRLETSRTLETKPTPWHEKPKGDVEVSSWIASTLCVANRTDTPTKLSKQKDGSTVSIFYGHVMGKQVKTRLIIYAKYYFFPN